MMEAETTKPHLNLMADGSEKHKQAMLSSPLESVAIGGKLLEGWTTPDFPSVFSHGRASIPLAAASTDSTKPPAPLAPPAKPAPAAKAPAAGKPQGAPIGAKKKQLPALTATEMKTEWRKWDAKLIAINNKMETALKQLARRKAEDDLAETANMIIEFGDRIDSIENPGFDKYVKPSGEVSYCPPPPPRAPLLRSALWLTQLQLVPSPSQE
jgi:hypothetical protein